MGYLASPMWYNAAMLELPRLVDQVHAMGEEIARRRADYARLLADARDALRRFDQVDQALMDKIDTAKREDSSWRGARPLDENVGLNARFIPQTPAEDVSLIAVDGSQIYPDRHGPALYYLINTGVIVLRQGTGQAPIVATRPQLFFREDDLYNDELELLHADKVNDLRELEEMRELARWTAQERAYWGGDLDRLILALTDGPLLTWAREDRQDPETQARIQAYLRALAAIQETGAVPIGYVARPRSANVLRLLHVAQLPEEAITKAHVRTSRYRALTDATLFADLRPNERTALFVSTAQVNEGEFALAGQKIAFFYLNVSRHENEPRIARVDIPVWATEQPGLVDRIHRAIYEDADGSGYPYVLIRAHELALITHHERMELESMLNIEVMRRTAQPLIPSVKQELKRHF